MEHELEVKLLPKEDLELSQANIDKVMKTYEQKSCSDLNNAVLKILKNIVREISRLIISINELEYASLHTRNIFELYLILIHIYSDKEALKCWYGQMYSDSDDVNEGVRKLLIKKDLETSSLDELQEFEDKILENSPYSSKKSFNIRNLAKIHGYEDDYAFVYKLSSKLVHPSSMKVNFYDILTEDDNFLNMIVLIAVHFGQKVEKLAEKIDSESA